MQAHLYEAIPVNRSVKGWKQIEIKECYDALVSLNDYSPDILVHPQYYIDHIPGALPICYCRQEVAKRLLKAAKELPHGHKFLVWDAWRPLEVQQELFESYKIKFKAETGLSGQQLDNYTQTFISLPSADEAKPSPHLTGGAVDLTIIDDKGRFLDMGTEFDYFGEAAQTDYYEQQTNFTKEGMVVRKNRRLLYNLLTSVGFSNYPHEWWHFDFGNQFWGIQTGNVAIFNKIKAP